jgi:hypothetical protein
MSAVSFSAKNSSRFSSKQKISESECEDEQRDEVKSLNNVPQIEKPSIEATDVKVKQLVPPDSQAEIN